MIDWLIKEIRNNKRDFMNYIAVSVWVHGWWLLLLCNLLFVFGKPPTLFAFLLFNGFGVALIFMSRFFAR